VDLLTAPASENAIEIEESASTVDPTEEGYDEAVETGVPFSAESEIVAWDSADPVPLTEAEAINADEIELQEPGRDLRPDSITPSPDMTSSDASALESIEAYVASELSADELTDDEAPTPTPAVSRDAASSGSDDEEKQDASSDAAK